MAQAEHQDELRKAHAQGVEDRINLETADLLKAGERHFPGTIEVLELYGGLEEATRQTALYLGLTAPPPPTFITSNNTY